MRSDMNIGREKPAMENFVCDLRAAVHTVARKPGFTIVVALMLAVGIATNTAIFSVVYGVLLRPLPYGQDNRPVRVAPGFFEALDAQPLRGRTFLPEEYQPGGIGGVVTHDPRYASHADRTIHLFDGRIAEIDNIGPGKERSS